MYGWIWRRLPFGTPGKLIGSLLLATVAGLLLWYVVFPWAEPLLPFDDVQVTEESVVPEDNPGPSPETTSNSPRPSATPSR